MFFSRKKKKESELDAAFAKVYEEIRGIDDWDNPKKLEHYILDSCEQIIATTKEIEAQKTEYRIITDYLKDIQTLQNLPVHPLMSLPRSPAHLLLMFRISPLLQLHTRPQVLLMFLRL